MTKHTALRAEHEALGASFTDFGGWDMPLKYASELTEHKAVRSAAGIFDISHMGEISVKGADAAAFLDYALAGRISAVAVGKAKYSLICNEDGGIIDDLITYRLGEDEYLVVPNAGNADTVWGEFQARAEGFDVQLENQSADTSLIAVQGPRAEEILRSVADDDTAAMLEALGYYAAQPGVLSGIEVLVARTGYTGEDGFELYVPNEKAAELWRAVLAAGEPLGLTPCGLASRDSLRLEAGMPLYGNELSLDVTPFEAGLGPVVALKTKERFVGRDALAARKEQGKTKSLVGLKGAGRRAARSGYAVLDADGNEVGVVTSGAPSPTLGYPVAMAYVPNELAEVGTELSVDLRGKPESFTVVELPFYRREK
ncbi:glycine cleavage system aminomethyltransferase GcvT [Falsarthrobacter nasiphocae]|uniref:Aminomethyltransferase n=1 Tax=Falsarthrobacter nasiphocae TaxID=189863 RepID=A0AAE3YF04_9MICC|nr:glycine cleavage system aminomethyltransferase GcvT [Falsarthrobacter nasiphocae]MDR6892184.1 aminomethyltransferase [Falsarthrobacter nasiphocae]